MSVTTSTNVKADAAYREDADQPRTSASLAAQRMKTVHIPIAVEVDIA